ncbi:adenylate/guanylate cyclase domain-containing protein [Thioalkalivibrio sulfidiphilus]|uniref:adenylate/guanylate cyclase domain-containing protein n=1 Tax=Thioalkalivibrio sulfidiphilus TaxID=1033854 RepID=UPI00036B2BC0|nr:adenylate/guanylate cyclase domain-containing protein [Thioalkalivibrio sulfidiphilus]
MSKRGTLRWLSSRLRRRWPSHVPVAHKLALIIAALAVLVMGILGAILLAQHTQTLRGQAESFGETLARQLAGASAELVMAEDRLALAALVNNLVQSEDIRGAAILAVDGTPMAQAGVQPDSGVVSEPWGQGRRWLIRETQEPVASHRAVLRYQQVELGQVVVTHSLAPLEATTRRAIGLVTGATLLMALLASLAAGILGKRLSRPIDDLMDASRAIGAGNYGFRFTERRNDEIGHLMESFNELARGLLEKSQVEAALSRYVSPGVARQILDNLEQVQLGGRHVEGTVLFADIAGFTSLSERLPPARVADLLNEYFGYITRIATHHQGTIDKFIGDCAMVVFGVTDPDPDHHVHALQCALMLQRLVARLNRQRDARGEPRVEFRIGINSGEMLAGNLGASDRMQYTVVGDTVNLASRLMGIAEPGQIVVRDEMMQDPRVSGIVHARQSDEIRVRGREAPVVTYRIEPAREEPELDRDIDQLLHAEPLR